MPGAPSKRVVISPILYMALSALLWPRTGFPALPPPVASASEESPGANSSGTAPRNGSKASGGEAAAESGIAWVMPRIRWGGNITYDMRSSTSNEGNKTMERGLIATLRAGTETFFWQPWFSRIGGDLNFTTSRNTAHANGDSASVGQDAGSRSIALSGNGRFSILPFSRFPFEAHMMRSNSMVNSDLSLPTDYVSQQIGFSQRYMRQNGDASLNFDRNMQSSGNTGTDRQDIVQAMFSQSLKDQRIQAIGNMSNNRRDGSGDYAKQQNFTLQHNYSSSSVFSLDSMASVSSTDNFLGRFRNESQLRQFNSQGFWRSEARPLLLTGGVRVLTVKTDATGQDIAGGEQVSSVRTANGNLGGSYDVTPEFHLNGGANFGITESLDQRHVSGSETLNASYTPAPHMFGNTAYNWSVSAGMSNFSGSGLSGHRENVQFGHNVSRSFTIDNGSSVTVDASETLSAARNSIGGAEDIAPSRMLTHSAGLSWAKSQNSSVTMMRLSASDSRGLDGTQDYFQMLNFQFSSNLQSGSYSSWNGNLTLQATRQGASAVALPFTAGENGAVVAQLSPSHHSFLTTSSGSVTYQHSRIFGVRNLRLSSDLRLNSLALLPVLGGPKDQETAAWENRITYGIGRTQFSVTTLIARSVVPQYGRNPDGSEKVRGAIQTNKAIMFTLMRSFGNY